MSNYKILYRGDGTSIDDFDVSKTEHSFSLYGRGIYLTDNEAVALSYTKNNTIPFFRADYKLSSPNMLLRNYINILVREKYGFADKANRMVSDVRNDYDNPLPPKGTPERKEILDKLTLDLKTLYKECLESAINDWKVTKKNVNFAKTPFGEWVMMKKTTTGFLSEFHVPNDYVKRLLNADAPMSDKALQAVRKTYDQFFRNRDGSTVESGVLPWVTVRNERGFTFDEFVKIYKEEGAIYSDGGGVRGGDGTNPSFDFIFNGQHSGFLLRDRMFDDLIKNLQLIGYVGFEFSAGVKLGDMIRGGGNEKHHTFVFWSNDVNKYRVNNKEVEDIKQAIRILNKPDDADDQIKRFVGESKTDEIESSLNLDDNHIIEYRMALSKDSIRHLETGSGSFFIGQIWAEEGHGNINGDDNIEVIFHAKLKDVELDKEETIATRVNYEGDDKSYAYVLVNRSIIEDVFITNRAGREIIPSKNIKFYA